MINTISLSRSKPKKQGVSPQKILNFIEAIEEKELELHGFMFLRHGNVISEGWWEPYKPNLKHTLFSLSKSFTSAAIGYAIEDGLITVEDTIISFFPNDISKKIDNNLSTMKIKHLLTMSTGHENDLTGKIYSAKDGNWVKAFFESPVENVPGTKFVYNSAATYMLSAIIQKVTSQTLLSYLESKLFNQLGILATWETCPNGINTGGWGLNITTEDIAKFGQLYLQKGMWNNKRILSEEWINTSTAVHIANGNDEDSDWSQGYGYQFWRCRHNIYRGDGAFGQFCIVIPDQDAVIAITSATNDMQSVLNCVWEYLLPAFDDLSNYADESIQETLEHKLTSLSLSDALKKHNSSPISKQVSNKHYEFEKNEYNIKTLWINFREDISTFTIVDNKYKHQLDCGIGKWLESKTTLLSYESEDSTQHLNKSLTAAIGNWKDPCTFILSIRFIETLFCYTIIFKFNDDNLMIEPSVNVSFGENNLPVIKGRVGKL